jgi:uncharacterized zinc-type alcohol dehydrogenase-like protein
MASNIGYAASDATSPLAPLEFDRRPVGPEDVRIDIKFCGVCHSDIHQARDEWGGALATVYPCVPGHEIVGIVAQVGSHAAKYTVGDRVGVGCMVDWGAEETRGLPDEQYRWSSLSSSIVVCCISDLPRLDQGLLAKRKGCRLRSVRAPPTHTR